jgi:hypothetical protein
MADLDERVPYEFCIGMTDKSGQHRMKQHSEGGDRPWRKFRNRQARPVRLREDLTEGLPRFRMKEKAPGGGRTTGTGDHHQCGPGVQRSARRAAQALRGAADEVTQGHGRR